MRLFDSLLRAGGLLKSGSSSSDGSTDCLDRQIRLWLHIDLTGSFTKWREQSPTFLKTTFDELVKKYPNLKFGVSGFGDRPPKPIGQIDDLCYVAAVDFNESYSSAKLARIKRMTDQVRESFNDLEEDPLTALPWIAKQKFGDFKDDELRILVALTDYGPHYGPLYTENTGTTDPASPAEDYVTCDSTKRWGTLNELMDPVKTRRIFPLFTIYSPSDPVAKSMAKWQTAVDSLGYGPDNLVDLGSTYNPQKFIKAIENLIAENKCSPAPTNAPSSGTIQTHPSETTTTATTTTAAATTTSGGTTSGGTTAAAAAADTTTATAATTTTHSGHSERTLPDEGHHTTEGADEGGNRVPIIVGASAGIAALVAAAAGARMLQNREPSLDIEEEEAVQAEGESQDREAAITLNEEAYE